MTTSDYKACVRWLRDEMLAPTEWSTGLRAARRPTPSLKEQALKALLHMDQGQHNERAMIIRRALEQLPDAPAATPDPAPTAGFWERHTVNVCPVCGNKRCPKGADPAMACTGSNEPGQPGSTYAGPAPTTDSPVPTDDELEKTYSTAGGEPFDFPDALRAVYNLGREHGAAAHAREQEIVRTGEWFRDRARGGAPAPTADGGVPLWRLMQKAHDKAATRRGGYAAELRVVADQIRRQWEAKHGTVHSVVDEVLDWLYSEADRAEAS